MYRIGIDLGGTKIEIAVLDDANQVLLRRRIPTEQAAGYNAIINKIAALYHETINSLNNPPHTLGIGVPGTISSKTGRIKNSNTICLNHQPLKEDLESHLNRPIRVENDANCFTLAEALLGAGRGYTMVFGVIMGTGCGGGIAINGKVHSGIQKIAGEWGHMQIDPAGPQCYCGKQGCVETYISGGGLEAIYRQRTGISVPAQKVIAAYHDGDPVATEVFHDFIRNFGVALSNVIAILDPDIVVLGGGLSNIDELYTLGRQSVEKYLFSDELVTPIVRNNLGDSAGVLGAAIIGI